MVEFDSLFSCARIIVLSLGRFTIASQRSAQPMLACFEAGIVELLVVVYRPAVLMRMDALRNIISLIPFLLFAIY